MTIKKHQDNFPELPNVEQLNRLAKSDVDQWRSLLITGGARLPFGSSAAYDLHPLRGYFDTRRFGDSDRFIYTELFTICAEKLGMVESTDTGEYRTVRAQVIASTHLHLEPWVGENLREPTLDWYMAKVAEHIQEAVAYALLDVAEKVACGVPLYKVSESSALPTVVADDEQPSAYLFGKWLHREVSRSQVTLPTWVHGHAFKRTDLEAALLFFGDSALELTTEQVTARRAAFRAHLGYSSPLAAAPTRSSATPSKLMAALHEVQSRYYGPNFSLGDQQTWPKQKDVVEWLKSSRGLSEREANSVDIVARPDALRGKP